MVALAADTPVRRGEVAAIERVIGDQQDWLEAQTGRRIRLAGPVRVVRMPWRSSAFRYLTPASFGRIRGAIPALPDGVISLVFYESRGSFMGGMADWPPLVPGHTAVVQVAGSPFTGAWGRRLGTLALHELFHALGLAAKDAPSSDGGGHVVDDRCDLMAPSQSCAAPTLDTDRADYWADLLASPFLV